MHSPPRATTPRARCWNTPGDGPTALAPRRSGIRFLMDAVAKRSSRCEVRLNREQRAAAAACPRTAPNEKEGRRWKELIVNLIIST